MSTLTDVAVPLSTTLTTLTTTEEGMEMTRSAKVLVSEKNEDDALMVNIYKLRKYGK